MSKPTLYRNRLIPLESILLTNDEILYHDDKKIITFWKTLHPKSILHTAIHVTFLTVALRSADFIRTAAILCIGIVTSLRQTTKKTATPMSLLICWRM